MCSFAVESLLKVSLTLVPILSISQDIQDYPVKIKIKKHL